jgi:hypothetical protein
MKVAATNYTTLCGTQKRLADPQICHLTERLNWTCPVSSSLNMFYALNGQGETFTWAMFLVTVLACTAVTTPMEYSYIVQGAAS